MKLCRACGQIKPLRFFHRRSQHRDGRNSYCIPCACAKTKAYQIANREEIKLRKAAHYQAHKDEIAAKNLKWRQTNRKRHREIARAAYERNKEKYIARANNYNKSHPELRRERTQRRRARLRGSSVEKVDYAAILDEHGRVCHLCAKPIGDDELHFDHVIPVARGGPHTTANIRPAHARCNLRKGVKLL